MASTAASDDWIKTKLDPPEPYQAVEQYADVKTTGEPSASIRQPAPSADVIDRIADGLQSWPIELCGLVARYVYHPPHVFYAPPIPWPKFVLTSTTATANFVPEANVPASAVPWNRCASIWTIGDGRRSWSIDYRQNRNEGWLACGVIGADARPLAVKQGEWSAGLYVDRDAYWYNDSCYDQVISVRFEADETTCQVVVVVGPLRHTLVDFRGQPDRFYNLRPAVLLAGTAYAILVD